MQKTFQNSEVINDHFTGFALFDPETEAFLFEYNSDKYFTPASNTKILTLYTSLLNLGDSVPGLYYQERGDTLVFWGTGDPSFLNPDVHQSGNVFTFLKNTEKTLVFSDANYNDQPFGPGWAWDDYNSYYSVEKAPFPIYGNYVIIERDSTLKPVRFYPDYFRKFWIPHDHDTLKSSIVRQRHNNMIDFYGSENAFFKKILPFKYDHDLFTTLLQDTLKKKVHYQRISMPENVSTLYSIPTDSLLAPMMIFSDNFIAEQLLLTVSGALSDTLNSYLAISHMQDSALKDLPQPPQWVDGSGLSRYNLNTPRSLVLLWNKIDEFTKDDRLFNIIAVGGVNGTIRNLYGGDTSPFVFAKTGSLRNNHCLSGFIITNQGRRLIFAYMNNNYTLSSARVKAEMDKVLRIVKEKY